MTLPLHVSAQVEIYLSNIAAFFQPDAKLTLLIRNDVGEGKDADAVFTNDTLPQAIEGLRRRIEASV